MGSRPWGMWKESGSTMREATTQQLSLQQLKRPRRVPAHASAQRGEVLRLLREAKARGQGLRRDDAIFQHRITQVGTRIFELERIGYEIDHRLEPGARFVTYFLIREPAKEKPLPTYLPKGSDPRQGTLANSPDWYEREHGPRPKTHPWKNAFSQKRLADPDCFALTPPEPR